MKSINPATGELVREYPLHTPGQVEDILVEAVNAQRGWRQAKVAERTAPLLRAAELLEERRDELAELAALEMGKPLPQGRAEADKCAWVCRYYAERAESMLADEPVDTDAYRSLVSYDPLGLVLAVMPWNFPYWQVFRFAAPALAAGNAALLKHAPNVPGCAEAIEEILTEEQLRIPREFSCASPQQLGESESGPILTPSPVKGTVHASLAWREETIIFWERASPPSGRLFPSLQLFDL